MEIKKVAIALVIVTIMLVGICVYQQMEIQQLKENQETQMELWQGNLDMWDAQNGINQKFLDMWEILIT